MMIVSMQKDECKIRAKFFFLRRCVIVICFGIFGCVSWASAQEKWEEAKSSHFIIYYRQAPLDFVQAIEKAAEEYYYEISDNFGHHPKVWEWDERAKIYIYDSAEQYVQESNQMEWSHGAASADKKIIYTFPTAHGFFDSTLPHELGHILFRDMVGLKAQVPAWFEEGIAMYQEKARRFGAHDAVRTALKDGTFIPLKNLTYGYLNQHNDPESIQLFYTESASIMNFLINENVESRFSRLCRKLKDGGPFDWALESVYFEYKNVDQLNDAWVEFLKK
jgi:hypothetical protein